MRRCEKLTKKGQPCKLCVGAGSTNACWRHRDVVVHTPMVPQEPVVSHDIVYGLLSFRIVTSLKYKQTLLRNMTLRFRATS